MMKIPFKSIPIQETLVNWHRDPNFNQIETLSFPHHSTDSTLVEEYISDSTFL